MSDKSNPDVGWELTNMSDKSNPDVGWELTNMSDKSNPDVGWELTNMSDKSNPDVGWELTNMSDKWFDHEQCAEDSLNTTIIGVCVKEYGPFKLGEPHSFEKNSDGGYRTVVDNKTHIFATEQAFNHFFDTLTVEEAEMEDAAYAGIKKLMSCIDEAMQEEDEPIVSGKAQFNLLIVNGRSIERVDWTGFVTHPRVTIGHILHDLITQMDYDTADSIGIELCAFGKRMAVMSFSWLEWSTIEQIEDDIERNAQLERLNKEILQLLTIGFNVNQGLITYDMVNGVQAG